MSPLMTLDPTFQPNKNSQQHGILVQHIHGLIKVYEDGHVERQHIIPRVTSSLAPDHLGVTSNDVVIDNYTKIWARFYVPNSYKGKLLPLLVYFHGGGFCVGSAAWSCYHEFLAQLAAKSGCLIMSVNYRLAPENPLPAAYNDGLKAVMWLKEQALNKEISSTSDQLCLKKCDFSSVYLAGDSAGANIAHNVSIRLDDEDFEPLVIKGRILIQPFFGGEKRTHSEEHMAQQPGSALSLATSDTYWRLSLPPGSDRDHAWCNPAAGRGGRCRKWGRTLVCVSELDILKDRNLEFVKGLGDEGEYVVYEGVGHAFHILNKSRLSQNRTSQMIFHIVAFLN